MIQDTRIVILKRLTQGDSRFRLLLFLSSARKGWSFLQQLITCAFQSVKPSKNGVRKVTGALFSRFKKVPWASSSIDSCRLWFLEAGEFCQRSADLGSDRLFISAFFPRGMPSWAFEADWKPEFFRPALRKLVKSLKTTLRQAIKPIPKAFFLLWYKNRIL